MNTRYLLLPALAIASLAAAQPTLNAGNNLPTTPSQFDITVRPEWVYQGDAGPGQLFGQWYLQGTDNRQIRYLSPSVTPTSAQMPGTTYLYTDGGSDTLFMQGDAQGLLLVGERTALGTFPYTDPARELVYPVTFNTTWTDPFTASYSVAGLPVTRTGTVTGLGDAYGTLQLPAREIQNVLRVKVRKQTTDASPFLTLTRATETWYFFVDTVRHPVLRLQIDTLGTAGGEPTVSREAQWLYGNGFASVGEIAFNDVVFTPYPNPADGPVDLLIAEAAGARELEVADATGRVVLRTALPAREGRVPGAFNTQGLAPGLYTLRLSDGARVIGTQRLVVR
jgi:hypothetical protein